MRKLVSRSPVQRFKEGKKLLVKTSPAKEETIGRYVREKNRSLFGSGWRWYDTQAPVGRSHVALDREIEQDGWILKPDGSKIKANIRNRSKQTQPTVTKQTTTKPKKTTTTSGNATPQQKQPAQQPVQQQRRPATKQATSTTQQPSKPKNSSNQGGFKTAFNNARNAGQETFSWNGKTFNTKNKGEENYVFQNGKWIAPAQESTSNITYTPGTMDRQGRFTPTGEPTTDINVAKQSLIPPRNFYPGTFNTNVTYNRGNIRSNRGINYSNVDEYWNYLNNNKDSNDFKLWSNIMRTQDGNLNREAFDQIMNRYGISGNLGRRDSRRLANLLNDLNLIGTEGSDARNSFIDSYNKQLDLASRAEKNGTVYSNNFNRVQPTSTFMQQPTNSNKLFSGFEDWNRYMKNKYSFLKKGGNILPSRNPVERFKQGGVQKFQKAGRLPTAPKAEDRYKNGYKYGSHLTVWSNGDGIDTRGVVSNNKIQYGRFPAVIQREIRENSNNIANQDTTYYEAPDFVSFPSALFQTLNPIQQSTVPALIKPKVKIRKASSKDKNKKEYEILKRRFNTAWNIAK